MRFPLLLIFALFLNGCFLLGRDPLPPGGDKVLTRGETERLVQELSFSPLDAPTLRALTKTTIVQDGEKTAFRQAFVIDAPARLRIEALPLTGFYNLGLLAIDRERVVLLDPQAREARTGLSAREAIEGFVGLELEIEEIAALLRGLLPHKLSNTLSGPKALGEIDPASQRVLVVSSDRRVVVVAEGDLKRLKRLELRSLSGRRIDLALQYTSYQRGGEFLYPEEIVIEVPRVDLKITLSLRSWREGGEIRDSLFSPVIPDSYQLR